MSKDFEQAEPIFEIQDWRSNRVVYDRTGKIICAGGFTAMLLLFLGVSWFISFVVEPTWGLESFVALGVASLLASVGISSTSLDELLKHRAEKKSHGGTLDGAMVKLVSDLYDEFEAVLKLRPPGEALDEILAVRAATNHVIEGYMQLRRMVATEDLSESSPVKWLTNTLKRLREVRYELEEVRAQGYLEGIALVDLEKSKAAIQEEQDLIASMLQPDPLESLGLQLDEALRTAPPSFHESLKNENG